MLCLRFCQSDADCCVGLQEALNLTRLPFPTSGRLNADVPSSWSDPGARTEGWVGLVTLIEAEPTNHVAEVKTGARCKSAQLLTSPGAGKQRRGCPLSSARSAGGRGSARLPSGRREWRRPSPSLFLQWMGVILLVRTSFVPRTPGVRATKGGPQILITEK